MKNISQANGPKKQAGTANLLTDKIDFKPKLIRKDERTLHTQQRKNSPRRHCDF